MAFKRLSSGGAVLEGKQAPEGGHLIRSAIFVHEGQFKSGDGPISFNEARLKIICRNMNKFLEDLEKEYKGNLPMGARPPFLDSHSDDSNDRVGGRIMGNFRVERRDVPKVGKDIACLVGDIAFLGAETIEKVLDGRIYCLSVGISEIENMLGEISGVVEPAAAGAMLLSKSKKSATPLARDSAVTNNKMRGNSMPKHLKRLAAHKARLSTIQGLIADTAKLTKLSGETKSATVHMIAESKVRVRLSGLMKSGRLTPAGYKKLDIKKLSALGSDALEMCMSALEANEPVIEPGQRGSRDAITASDLRAQAGETSFKRLKDEARSDVNRMMGKKSLKKLGAGEAEPEKKMSAHEAVEKKMAGYGAEGGEPDKKRMAEYAKCLSELSASIEGGDKDMSKKHLASLSAFGEDATKMAIGDPAPEVEAAQMGIQEQIDALNVNLSKVVDCLKHLLVAEEAEGTDLAAEGAVEGGADGGDPAVDPSEPVPEPGEKKPPVKEEKAPDAK